MFKNYFKIFFRNMNRHKDYSLINIFGLTLGMATCILIMLYVKYELNWDTSHANADRIYRVQQIVNFTNYTDYYTGTGYIVADELKANVPEIEQTTVLREIWGEYLNSAENRTFWEKYGYYADNSVFDIFTFPLVAGNSQTALSQPFSVVLTEELVQKYFPNEDPMGKFIKASNNKLLKVTGVLKNLPFNIDLRPDYLVSFSTFREITSWKDFDKPEQISSGGFRNYVLLKENASAKLVNQKIHNLIDKYVPKNNKNLYLKPIKEIHVKATEENDIQIAYYYLGGISLFVLLLACVNFINLATANSHLRKKEIGIRKVVGGSRLSLFRQFVSESLIYALFSMVLAFILAELALPYFKTIVQRPLEIHYFSDLQFILGLSSIFVLTGILAGIYPALYLSSFQPVEIIKGQLSSLFNQKKKVSKSYVRKSLVVFQFVISMTIVISTIYVSKQIDFMKNKDLGFNKENLLFVDVAGERTEGSFEPLQNELIRHPKIEKATYSLNAPFHGSWGAEINWEGSAPEEKMNVRYNGVGYDFIDTYRMKIVKGRNFSPEFSTADKACLINEEAWQQMGWDDPIGKKINDNKYTVIGVVRDFHSFSVHNKIMPFYMFLGPATLDWAHRFSIRILPGDEAATIQFVNQTFRKFYPEAIVDTRFFTDNMSYGTEDVWEILGKIFLAFSIIAILIATNGLYGLMSFAVQRRIKEIGIRKVLGARIPQLYYLISREFLTLLILAVVIAAPLGFVVSKTTPGAYKYNLQTIDYAFSIFLMLATAFLATWYHTTRAVLANPVEALRDE